MLQYGLFTYCRHNGEGLLGLEADGPSRQPSSFSSSRLDSSLALLLPKSIILLIAFPIVSLVYVRFYQKHRSSSLMEKQHQQKLPCDMNGRANNRRIMRFTVLTLVRPPTTRPKHGSDFLSVRTHSFPLLLLARLTPIYCSGDDRTIVQGNGSRRRGSRFLHTAVFGRVSRVLECLS